jgi:hypothetical protein
MTSVIGWWKLLSWTQEYDDGRKIAPFGEKVVGRLTYGETGDFAVLISRPDRAPFTTGGQWTAEDHEKAKSYDAMLAYYGRYEFDGEKMHHQVEASLYPNWAGHTQVRLADIDGDILTLSARLEESTSEARTAELVWRRITN